MTDMPQIINNAAASRLEVTVDGHLAELVYRRRGTRLVIVHTGVPDALAGHGIGGRLVADAVARAAAEGLTVVPLCPFARSWLSSHPEAAATVNVDWGDQP
jgi:predicted GNAT family acetyltransferase